MIERRPPDWCGQTTSAQQTRAVGQILARHCRAGDLLALTGELGAGKTQLVKGLARGLGLDEHAVASPTFVMVQEYHQKKGEEAANPGLVLVHVDAYRVRSLQDLESMGWQPEAWQAGGELRQGAVLALEWADRLGGLLGEDYLQIELSHAATDGREICMIGFASWAQRLREFRGELDRVVQKPQADWAPCPVCAKAASVHTAEFPFCSPRCKMIDLGRWLDERYVISRPLEQRDLEEGR